MASKSEAATAKMAFHDLEVAALTAIADQYPMHRDELLAQFRLARVTRRRNSGAGFFTDFEVDRHRVPPVTVPRIFGDVWMDIGGFEAPMTFLIFSDDGYANCLEGATGGDDTRTVDFSELQFRLRAPSATATPGHAACFP